ncbi:D-glycero-beta-D-manno-heptose 1,7-bisphosphate 7-phosphatase [Mycolicibacterium sphagni]|uniref:D,D-heptose 1,7-bisphosphate phosphatase n=1 Tax=Mycolicibacterium sphagni TaxID=1786 RepID=A0ABX2K7N2_9MYCO|nr:D-glycero-beta-D-manno-heptose 1,7-bisphosphate 7-phosphatase [Mycolicibacterium sphagni]NTY62220.1 D-glycero-beta-D-manno-heptose 1,7-bisphosphate 7-phosphatase [Mycolicibacterium sphagni]
MASDVKSQKLRGAAFLDRDGVLNVDHGFVVKPQDFEWVDGAREAIRYLNEAGYVTVVVTNQSGIARGYFTESEFRALHRWIDEDLRESGAHIDAVYFCPHHPDAALPAYRRDCTCRKPQPGMLFRAIRELNIDPTSSFLIGDKPRDCAAAVGASVASHLFTGSGLLDLVRGIVANAKPGAPHTDR